MQKEDTCWIKWDQVSGTITAQTDCCWTLECAFVSVFVRECVCVQGDEFISPTQTKDVYLSRVASLQAKQANKWEARRSSMYNDVILQKLEVRNNIQM